MHPSLLLGQHTHRELFDLLKNKGELTVSGASNETAKALLLSHLLDFDHPRRVLLVTENDAGAEGLIHWLRFFGHNAEILRSPRTKEDTIDGEALQRFLSHYEPVPHAKVGSPSSVLITTQDRILNTFPAYESMKKKAITFIKGKETPFTELVENLLAGGYSHGDDQVLHVGEYRRIGDILEIFPAQTPHPYRVHFEFDTVTKIEKIDAENRDHIHPAGDELLVMPAMWDEELELLAQLPEDSLLVFDDQDEAVKPDDIETLFFTSFPEGKDHHAHLRYLSVLKFYTLTDFLNDVRDKLQQKWTLVVVSKRADELKAILKDEHISSAGSDEARPGAVTVIESQEGDLLPHSLQNPDLQVALLTDREIFTLKKSGRERSVSKLALDFITSLQPGDYVVHMDHGIGHFEGMTQKTIDEVSREYLELTYAGGDKLFVPVDQADKLSKFVHEEGEEPVLTRLGTVEWKRVSDKMKEETRAIAKELLNLYAKRAKSRGHSFGHDTELQRKFEEAFPYTETPGQMKAIQDIKTDMESGHPMDRLVCGDVGFGKTEVAMRAAFKAVQGGKQVAVIAPITILADQHFKNFTERMAAFNIKVDMMSRFRSAAEQKVTLEKLRKGDVDIVVGTHRLLQDDVKFFNLGLVVIDEEQRFGVKQKEKFKEMRADVDILTLTATPIPRTLNLGLHKLRDISTITTPPPGRLPIITEVRKYSDALIRQAITTELERTGQCFVLHNKVETIDAFAAKLKALIPKATFVVGHGQLKPEVLEERILSFKEGRVDVLVSSTIIENGIDLPRANTLVVNEAEKFGLSQLYQLRGRVGRGKLQAFAYFLYHSQKLKDDAKKRLRAIVEACELGSGFQVAMRDLEIRGAGEILGASQSGSMQTVGVSHYLRMLKAAVEELRRGGKEEVEIEENVEIQLPVEAFIPAFYITESEDKISVYQKLAGSESEEILKEFETDLREEYGEPPRQVQSLFAILRLKLACRRSGVIRIKAEDKNKGERDIVLTLSSRVTAKEIMQLLSVNPQWKISGNQLRVTEAALVSKSKGHDLLAALTKEVAMLEKKAEKKKEVDKEEAA